MSKLPVSHKINPSKIDWSHDFPLMNDSPPSPQTQVSFANRCSKKKDVAIT